MKFNSSRREGGTARMHPWWVTFNPEGSIDGGVGTNEVRHCAKATWGDNNSSGGERHDENGVVDTDYWQTLLDPQLKVNFNLAKI